MSTFEAIPRASESFPMARSLFGRPSKSAYKAAVSQVIREIKARHNLSSNRLAEVLVCDEKTVRNAEDGDNGCLDPVILLNIAYAFGEEAIHPVRELYLCAPVDQPTKDNLIQRAISLLSQAEQMGREVKKSELSGDVHFPFRDGESAE